MDLEETESGTAQSGQESAIGATRQMRLAIVIINYRTPGLVLDCLETLDGQVVPGVDEVVVVDNDSGDGSAQEISGQIMSRGWAGWARVLETGRNGGFSAGNNAGIRASDALFYLLLNSDTLVRPGAVAELLRAAEKLPNAGLIGPRLEYLDGKSQQSAFRKPTVLSQLERSACVGLISMLLKRHIVATPVSDSPRRAEWVSFACVLIRRACLERVGPMDEGMFMYFEDIDYANRSLRAGFEVWYYPEARVVHLRGGSSEVKKNAAARKRLPGYYYAARARHFHRDFGLLGLWTANLLWELGTIFAFVAAFQPGRRFGLPRRAWLDVWRLHASTPAGKRGVFVEPEIEPLFTKDQSGDSEIRRVRHGHAQTA